MDRSINIIKKILTFISIIFFIFAIFLLIGRLFEINDIMVKRIPKTIYFFSLLNFLHFFVGVIAYLIFAPTRGDEKYQKIFDKSFPICHYLCYFLGFSIFILFFYVLNWQQMNFIEKIIYDNIDYFYNKYTVLLTLVFCVIYNIILLSFIYLEYNKVYDEINKVRPGFEYSLWVGSYCSSFILISSILFISNYRLDLSNEEEKIVNILDSKCRTVESFNKKYYLFELSIEPNVYGRSTVAVPQMIQLEAKKGDKLRLYVKKGLFGVRYITNDKKLIKKTE